MFDNPIVKYCALGCAGAAFVGGFVVMNLRGESQICQDALFGNYNDAAGVCEVNGSYASNLIIVAGNTANSPVPNYKKPSGDNKNIAYDYLKNSIAKSANIKIVSAATGNAVEYVEIKRNETNDAAGFVESVEQAINEVNEKISQAPATDGATYYEAISKAGLDASTAKKANANDADSNNDIAAIMVFGSGLSDGGILNFAGDDLLHSDVAKIISRLERAGELTKDMDNVKIIWSGIGQTVMPQLDLFNSERNQLKEIYKQVLSRRGGEIVFDDNMQDSKSIENNTHTVKPTTPGIVLDAELLFRPDSAEFIDEQKAYEALEKTINDAKLHAGYRIKITGYMASGNCEGKANTTLAGARAETVKQFLKKNNVSNEMETVNGGVYDPEKTECDASGWNPELANYRRKVIIEFN